MTVRLIVSGSAVQDRDLVYKTLTKFMFPENDVIIIAPVFANKIYARVPWEFPMGVDWLRRMWFRSKDPKKKRYSLVEDRFPPTPREKKFKGQEIWYSPSFIRGLVREATHVVVFWEVGNVPLRDKYLWRLSEIYDLKRLKVLM
jgi:hypothetical protein